MKNLILIYFTAVATITGFSQKSIVWATVKNVEVLNNLNVKFKKAFPSSRQKSLQNVYEFTCDCNEADLYTSLHKISEITGIEYGPKYQTLSTPNDYSIYGSDYALNLINAEQAWSITTGDPSIIIAISDANYYIYHEELAGKLDYISPDNFSADYTHGTAVAITAAGNTNNGTGKSSIGYNSHLQLRVMDYNEILDATYSGVKIINVSWTSGCYNSYYAQQVIDEAYNNGSVIVAAAGNGGTCGGASNLVYPASLNHVISVTSVGPNKNHERTIGNPSTTHQHNASVDLSAPGYDMLLSTSPGQYITGNGSSFAAPTVSGTIALMLSVNKCLTPDQIEYILKSTADSTMYQMNQNYTGLLGAGVVDAYKAVEMAKRFNTFQAELKTDVNCALNERQAKVLNINGQLPLTFKWSNGLTTDKIEIDTTDFYSVEITDNAGCKFYDGREIEIYNEMNLQSDINHITCFGLDNGSINVQVTGGDSTYTYYWSTGDMQNNLTHLKPGQYVLNVMDNAGCVKTETYTIFQPELLVTSLNYTQPTQTTFGSIDLNVVGGAQPYTYNWNHGETSEDLNNIVADFYEVLVTDANGCMSSENVILNNAPIQTAGIIDLMENTNANNSIVLDLNGKQVNLDQAATGYYLIVENGKVTRKIYKN